MMLSNITSTLFSLVTRFKIGAIVGFSYSLIALIIHFISANSGEFSGMVNTLPFFIQLILLFPYLVLTLIWTPFVLLEVYFQNTFFAYATSTSFSYQFKDDFASSYLAPAILLFLFTMLGVFFQKMIGYVKR